VKSERADRKYTQAAAARKRGAADTAQQELQEAVVRGLGAREGAAARATGAQRPGSRLFDCKCTCALACHSGRGGSAALYHPTNGPFPCACCPTQFAARVEARAAKLAREAELAQRVTMGERWPSGSAG
jgi:cytochrome c peroxidase